MQSKVYIYGKHAVAGALTSAPRIVRKVLVSPKMDDKKLRDLIYHSGVETGVLDERQATSQVEGGAAHQGVIALVALAQLVVPFEKFLDSFSPTPDTCLVLVSEVKDPQNLGAIIRSAAAFGAQAVLMPTHKQSPVTGAAIKASAGTAFSIPLVEMTNMQQALAQLKKKGVVVYGLEAGAKKPLQDEPFSAPTLLVLGNEAAGIAPAAKALCDHTLSIPLSAGVESLNVAASGAVALYAWRQRHPH